MNKKISSLILLGGALLSGACSLDVQMQHEPAVATSSDRITFTAEAQTEGTVTNLQIEMFVDGVLVQTCGTSPCVFEGGPYAVHENDWLGYHAEVTADLSDSGFSGSYANSDLGYTGITESDYSWKDDAGVQFIPVRWGDWSWLNTNVLVQRASDYNTGAAGGLTAFLEDVGDKLIDVLMAKEGIWGNMNDINVYAYRKSGQNNQATCGTLHADTVSDTYGAMDDYGLLHTTNYGDCTSGFERFTAEGSTNTQAFLHEFSHSIFEQADEYSGFTFYFEADDEPNIFDTEEACRDEQDAKGRDPDDCYQFTANQDGWWGTHTGITVMTNGLVTHPWSLESTERNQWWFNNN